MDNYLKNWFTYSKTLNCLINKLIWEEKKGRKLIIINNKNNSLLKLIESILELSDWGGRRPKLWVHYVQTTKTDILRSILSVFSPFSVFLFFITLDCLFQPAADYTNVCWKSKTKKYYISYIFFKKSILTGIITGAGCAESLTEKLCSCDWNCTEHASISYISAVRCWKTTRTPATTGSPAAARQEIETYPLEMLRYLFPFPMTIQIPELCVWADSDCPSNSTVF